MSTVNNSGNQQFDNNSDGFDISGGTTKRKLTVSGGNPTLSGSPTISGSGSAVITLPGTSDTLVGRATTDTLTNKTISGSSNTVSNISNSQVSFSGGVTSYTNTGSAGGTFYYVNLGGIKLLWGTTNNLSVGGSTSASGGVNFPASFFTTVTYISVTTTAYSNSAMYAGNTLATPATSPSGTTVYVQNGTATAQTSYVTLLAIGT